MVSDVESSENQMKRNPESRREERAGPPGLLPHSCSARAMTGCLPAATARTSVWKYLPLLLLKSSFVFKFLLPIYVLLGNQILKPQSWKKLS